MLEVFYPLLNDLTERDSVALCERIGMMDESAGIDSSGMMNPVTDGECSISLTLMLYLPFPDWGL